MISKLDKLVEKQHALEKMRRDFVANVSHELRTPLTVIHGYLDVLMTGEIGEGRVKELQKIFGQMYQQTTRMENIISDLLLLSKLESGEEDVPHKKNVDMAELLKTIVRDAKAFSSSAKHKFYLEADSQLKIKGNENELRSLASNLVINAVKYTPPQGKIFVRWLREGSDAYLLVKDTGIGVAKKHLPRLTERFYRVDKARSRSSGGTGLGLAIVKHVLLRHHGKLHVESKLGKGSTFTCIFSLK